jgi:hypothetical protein
VVDENVSMPESDGLVIGEVCYYGLEILFPFPEDNRGRLWVPFSSGENIVYGKNGAGKSTVISAIKSALSGLKDAALEAEIYLYIKILDNGDDSSADLEEPEAFLENEQEFINEDEESDDLSETSEHLENAFDSEVEDASHVLFGELVELEGSVVKSFVEGIARADILKGHLEGYDLDAFFEVAKKRGFHPPNISPGHFLTSDSTIQLSSAITGSFEYLYTSFIPSRSSFPSGCSINSTPSLASSSEFRMACSAVQAQLASIRKIAFVCFRSSRTISRSFSVPNLIL